MSDDKHHSFFPESWEELEKMLRQKADQTLEGLEQARQRLDDAVERVKIVGQDSARDAAQRTVYEAREAFKRAKSDWMRVKIETSIADLRTQTEGRLQHFADCRTARERSGQSRSQRRKAVKSFRNHRAKNRGFCACGEYGLAVRFTG